MSLIPTAASVDWEGLLILLALVAVMYGAGGYILRSATPGGKLSWSGRRWRWVFTVAVALSFLGMKAVNTWSLALRLTLWGVLGLLGILFIRWWWRDYGNEKAAREALVEKLHREGREPVAPPLSPGRKAWRWVLNGYAIALVLGLVYGLVRYLVRH